MSVRVAINGFGRIGRNHDLLCAPCIDAEWLLNQNVFAGPQRGDSLRHMPVHGGRNINSIGPSVREGFVNAVKDFGCAKRFGDGLGASFTAAYPQ